MTTTMALFETQIKNFITSTVIGPLANVAVKNKDLEEEELVKKFIEALDLPSRSTPLLNVKPQRKRSPVVKQRWITMDEYKEQVKKHLLCSYVQTRGTNKDRYCGVVLDENSTVKLENGIFVPSTAEDELQAVKGNKAEVRCKCCWSRDPKTGVQKRKKGRGDKLVSEKKGSIVAPKIIAGVSLPSSEGLMGFLSGNTEKFQSPSRAMEVKKKVLRAKRFPGLLRTSSVSHVVPNPSHHEDIGCWLIKADSKGQSVIGKFKERPSSSTVYDKEYIDDVVPLSEDEIAQTKEYGLSYNPIEFKNVEPQKQDSEDEDDDEEGIPTVAEPEDDTGTIQDSLDLDIPTLMG